MKCVILQPSYIPWRGYFDQIRRADLFIFYDDVQYDKRGWRNRNQIKTANGKQWLTIPVHSHGAQTNHLLIKDVLVSYESNSLWTSDHIKSIHHAYAHAPYFKEIMAFLEPFYEVKPVLLTDFIIDLTMAISDYLGITATRFMRSSELNAKGAKTDRLIELLQQVNATEYISGPSAKDYIEMEKFSSAGIKVEYLNYNYLEYPQLYPPYDKNVSIVDLLMMMGKNSINYITEEKVE